MQEEDDWSIVQICVRENASIGSNATIMGGMSIGKNAMVGAGAMVNHDVPENMIVAGVPASIIGDIRDRNKESVK
jgi:UDP-2-acetamido-3-amino-2,3-dideoxy-glucuronate N-acetyltransferase